jgi:hypothetical protein
MSTDFKRQRPVSQAQPDQIRSFWTACKIRNAEKKGEKNQSPNPGTNSLNLARSQKMNLQPTLGHLPNGKHLYLKSAQNLKTCPPLTSERKVAGDTAQNSLKLPGSVQIKGGRYPEYRDFLLIINGPDSLPPHSKRNPSVPIIGRHQPHEKLL